MTYHIKQIDVIRNGEVKPFKKVTIVKHKLIVEDIEVFRKKLEKKYKNKVQVYLTYKSK